MQRRLLLIAVFVLGLLSPFLAPVSLAAKGRVFAAVGLDLGHTTVAAGDCVQAGIGVQPARPGQRALLQQEGPKGWRTLDTLQLDSSSRASTKLCEGWGAIGSHVL